MKYFILLFFCFNIISQADTAQNKTAEVNKTKPQTTCEEVKLDIQRSKSIKALTAEFKKIPRELLISGMWYELKNYKSQDSLILPILYFLSGTESKKDVRGFYKMTTWLLVDTEDQEKILKSWPKRPVISAKNLDKEQLCELYSKAQEGTK